MKKITTTKQSQTITTIQVMDDGTLVQMMDDGTSKLYTEASQTDWQRVDGLSDSEIDTSDIPSLEVDFWQKAKVVPARNKKSTTIRLDAEVVDWFKNQGQGWQTRMNGVLRSYYQAHATSSNSAP